jgi:hypothetical protein
MSVIVDGHPNYDVRTTITPPSDIAVADRQQRHLEID